MWTFLSTGLILLIVTDILSDVTVEGKGGRPRIGKRRDIRMADEDWSYLAERGDGQAARGLRRVLADDRARTAAAKAKVRTRKG